MDNALPHLESNEQIIQAATQIRAKLRPGGLLMASIRHYVRLIEEKPVVHGPSFHSDQGHRRIVFQVWDWVDDRRYVFHVYITRETATGWQTIHAAALYRAILMDELAAAMDRAGFKNVRWLSPGESGFYQPIVLAEAGGTGSVAKPTTRQLEFRVANSGRAGLALSRKLIVFACPLVRVQHNFGVMKIKLAGLVFAAPLVIWASTPVPLLAHHPFAKFFDVNKPIHIEGVVRRVEWRQPHVEFVVDVRDRKNETTSWLFEINPIKILNKYGWDQDTVKPGMEILVDGFQARDPSIHRAVGSSITIKATGKVLATPLGEDRLPSDDVPPPPALFELDENTGLIFLGFLVIGTGLIAVLLIRRSFHRQFPELKR